MGIDGQEVIDAAPQSRSVSCAFLSRGQALAGTAFRSLLSDVEAREYDFSTRFIELAGEINTQMPYHVVTVSCGELSERRVALRGAKILVLGLPTRRTSTISESPSLKDH